MRQRLLIFSAMLCLAAPCVAQGRDVPVPRSCTPAINQKLEQMIRERPSGYVENVMVCGVSRGTRVNSGGRHGSHHIITISAPLSDHTSALVQVAVNDSLDGPVSAGIGQAVFAYGQGYISGGPWAAGVHDVHCSTHRSADNGWVVVNGVKAPASCASR